MEKTAEATLAPGFVSGALTVLRASTRHGLWRCRCRCGAEREVRGSTLRSGGSASCTCQRVAAVVAASTKHGFAAGGASYEYEAWQQMKKMCADPARDSWEYFGGKGIKVHPRWENSFPQFLKDVGECPATDLVIGRKDKSKDFEPGNVAWMTSPRRALKKDDRREVTIAGVTKQLCEWAASSGISKTTLHYRLAHWPEERWLEPPLRRGPRRR